jgi:hypothetical protein
VRLSNGHVSARQAKLPFSKKIFRTVADRRDSVFRSGH